MRRRRYLAAGGSVLAALAEGTGELRQPVTSQVRGLLDDTDSIAVEIVETNAPIEGGDRLDLTIAVENRGTDDTRVSIENNVQGIERRTTIEAGETETVEQSFLTAPVESETEETVRVEANGATAEETVELQPADTLDPEQTRPDRELTVAPDTTVFFEIESDALGAYGGQTEWFVDGDSVGRSMGPWFSTYYASQGREYWEQTFESPGRYEVSGVVHGEDDVLQATWTVTVDDGATGSAAIESHTPDDETLELDRDETVTLDVDLSHPDGGLDRVVWWLSQADIVLGESDVSGGEDTASIELEDGCHTCAIVVWVIATDGTITTEAIWTIDESPGDPAVSVEITATNDPVDAGDVLDVEAALDNATDAEVTRDVDLIVGHDPETVDGASVTIPGNETETVDLTFETAIVPRTQQFPARVETDDDADEVTVEVIGDDDVGLDATITDTNSPVQTGDRLDVTVELTNTHDAALTREPQLVVGHHPTVVDAEVVTVEPGETETITVGYETAVVATPQRFPARVETVVDADDVSVFVYVDEPPLLVSILETNDPVDSGDELVVTAEVENSGESPVEDRIELIVGHDPQLVDDATVTVEGGETETIDLRFETATVPRTQEFPVRVESDGDAAVRDVVVIGTEEDEYDDEDDDIEIAFQSCTEAAISGTFEDGDSVTVETLFVTAAGPGNAHPGFTFDDDVDTPFTGTVQFEVADETGIVDRSDDEITVGLTDEGFGSTIHSVIYNWMTPDEIAETNPADCLDDRRPERPSIAVGDVTPTDDGPIAVTFESENPNELQLDGGEFVEGTTDDEPEPLEPGSDSFTVNWTPDSVDERLVWEIDLEPYLYDDSIQAATDPASEYVELDVAIVAAPETIEPGEVLEVRAEIDGPEGVVDEAVLVVDGDPVDSESIDTTVDFASEIPDDEPDGELTVRVDVGEEADETTVEVVDPGRPEFELSIVSTTEPVQPGEALELVAAVENVGDADPEDDVLVTLFVDGSDVATETVAPDAGASSEVTFVYSVTDDDVGELDVAITMQPPDIPAVVAEAADEEATTTVTVEEPAEPAEFAVIGLSAPGSIDPGETIDVAAEVQNVGDEAGETTVQLDVDGQQGVDSQSLSLDSGQTGSVTLTDTTPADARGTLTVTVRTPDDSQSQSIAIDDPEPETEDDEIDDDDTTAEEPDPEPDPEPEPEPDTEPEPEPDTETQSEPEPEPDTEPQPEPEPDTPSEPEPNSE